MTKPSPTLATTAALTALALAGAPMLLAATAGAQRPSSPRQPSELSAPTPALAGFSPESVTYVSTSQGWVLGTVPCARSRCLKLLHTTDDGASWSAVPVPPTGAIGDDEPPLRARFANSEDGWIFSALPGQAPVEAWSTHNGGHDWSRLVFFAPKADGPAGIEDLEAAHGTVDAAVQVADQVDIYASPVATNSWHQVGGPYQLGAGPVPTGQLTLQAGSGWFVQDNRVVVSGGRELPSGRWAGWAPPCAKAGGPATLAGASPSQLDALCTEGEWTGTKVTVDLLRSSDGGLRFGPSRQLPVTAADLVAAGNASTVAIGADVTGSAAGDVELEMSFDSGASWQSVYRHPGGGWTELGFTTPLQGVAIFQGPNGGTNTMLFTTDGGRQWGPVRFG